MFFENFSHIFVAKLDNCLNPDAISDPDFLLAVPVDAQKLGTFLMLGLEIF